MFVVVTVILIFGILFFCGYNALTYKVSLLDDGNDDYERSQMIYNYFGFACFGLSWAFLCSGQWIFSMKYWIVAYRLQQGQYVDFAKIIFKFMILLNILVSLNAGVIFALGKEELASRSFGAVIIV